MFISHVSSPERGEESWKDMLIFAKAVLASFPSDRLWEKKKLGLLLSMEMGTPAVSGHHLPGVQA